MKYWCQHDAPVTSRRHNARPVVRCGGYDLAVQTHRTAADVRFQTRSERRAGATAVTTVIERPDDDLARDVRLALGELLEIHEGVRYPDGIPVGPALWGSHADSPSLVWHCQAIEALLELGYHVGDAAFADHLAVMKARVDESNYFDPETTSVADVTRFPWVLRTRHVSWILRCLYSAHGSVDEVGGNNGGEADPIRTSIAEKAFALLGGDGRVGRAASWIGMRTGEQYWSEHWHRRRPNVLNSVYAARAVCRASRYGLRVDDSRSWSGQPTPAGAVTSLVRSIVIEPRSGGPRARLLDEGWVEPWTHNDELPCAVVALFAMLLAEYARLVASTGSSEAAAQASDKARRLGHELLARSAEWTDAVEGFSYEGAEGGWWFIPTFSLGMQAILETAAASPQHPVIAEAIDTIRMLASSREGPEGAFETWRDPTRSRDLVRQFGDDATQAWHGVGQVGKVDLSSCQSTAGSIHAAAMAWSALRRSIQTGDPRTLLQSHAVPRLPASQFQAIVLDAFPTDRIWQAQLESDDGYTESMSLRSGAAHLIEACAQLTSPADVSAIARIVATNVPEHTGIRATRTGEGVRAGIRELNRNVGFALIRADASEPPTYVLACRLWRKALAELRQGDASFNVTLRWAAVAPADSGYWTGVYEVVAGADHGHELANGDSELVIAGEIHRVTLSVEAAHGTKGTFTAQGRLPQFR